MRRRANALSHLHLAQGQTRTILGKDLMIGAANVTELTDRVASHTIEMEWGQEWLIDNMFAPEAVAKLRAVKGLVTPESQRAFYSIVDGVKLSMDFDPTSVVTPLNSAWQPQPGAYKFIHAAEQAKAVYDSFCKVRHVMNWMDCNATPGAVRHYWPTMLSLVPDNAALKEASSVRHNTPAGITSLLPLLRETASTVASALLLPKVERTPTSHVSMLILGTHGLNVYDQRIETPMHTLFLKHGPTA